jgi:Phosphodiester glycosidase
LARIDPALFRFEVRSRPAGDREVLDWLSELGAVLVINGSYYARDGTPDTPILSNGAQLGPTVYRATHGAFVTANATAGIRDLAAESWENAFHGARNAMVSYPLLLAADGSSRVKADRRWLANRSFVGEDAAGRIVVGTTKDAFFSLEALAEFLREAPLELKLVLNLDGGPLACQAIALNSLHRDFCGEWETAVRDGDLQLLRPLLGSRRWGLPIVLAIYRK